jgi:hypothetical protein
VQSRHSELRLQVSSFMARLAEAVALERAQVPERREPVRKGLPRPVRRGLIRLAEPRG